MLELRGTRIRCKHDRYSYCDIDEPETLCDGCEYGLEWLAVLEDETTEPDPDEAWEKFKEERWNARHE